MRFFVALRQVGAVGAVERREHRVFPAGRAPTFPQAFAGDTHPVSWLMAVHASASVGPEWSEERVSARVHRPGSLENPQLSEKIPDFVERGQNFLAPRLDPRDS